MKPGDYVYATSGSPTGAPDAIGVVVSYAELDGGIYVAFGTADKYDMDSWLYQEKSLIPVTDLTEIAAAKLLQGI